MADTFTCDNCGGTFEKGRSDEAAALFGDVAAEDCAVVCDDCWRAMGFVEEQ